MNNFYFSSQLFNKKHISIIKKMKNSIHRSSHPEVLLGKAVLKICSSFTGEHPDDDTRREHPTTPFDVTTR